jgi:hypothetical protein
LWPPSSAKGRAAGIFRPDAPSGRCESMRL